MFGLFTSAQKRARHDARNWLHLAGRVYHFRRDQLPPAELHAIQQATQELRNRLKERADAAKLKMAMDQLETCLRRSGGVHYPKSSFVDNVEFFLVAAILFLGIRAFFIQPFKIPTNSMWPSYYGMTHEVFATPEDEPGVVSQAVRFAAFGAMRYSVNAPADGEVKLVMVPTGDSGFSYFREVPKRRWLIFPGKAKEYTLLVGRTPVTLTLPTDFRFERVLEQAFFQNGAAMGSAVTQALREARYSPYTFGSAGIGRSRTVEVSTGLKVRAGERVLAFDILTGDQLFVDRVSYHFVRPSIGDGFVFRTGNIPNIPGDQYYVKRLVGVAGDKLEIRPPQLLRNGEPIEGAEAFQRNGRREGAYPGYVNRDALGPGMVVEVPADSFYALGDNSPDSADSRMWGRVPAGDVVGRPLFIYYPFTRRWGPAR